MSDCESALCIGNEIGMNEWIGEWVWLEREKEGEVLVLER